MDRYVVNTNARSVVYEREVAVRPQIFGFMLGSAVHLVRGPVRILLRHDAHSTERAFVLIFRLILRPLGGGIESWAVFRRQGDWQGEPDEDDPGCVLWHANWDQRTDWASEAWRRDLSKETWREDRFPTLQTTVRYVREPRCALLGSLFEVLDRIVVNGVALPEVERINIPTWREYSLLRCVDWGIVDLTWSDSRQNEQCEAAGMTIAGKIEDLLEEEQSESDKIEALTMVFDWSPYFPEEVIRPIHTNRR